MAKKTKKKPLTKKQKLAISIAKDALKQFMSGTYEAKSGTLVSIPDLDDILTEEYGGGSVAGSNKKVELQPFLKKALKKGATCDVCIRGGLLLSTIVKEDKFKTNLIEEELFSVDASELVEKVTPRWTGDFITTYNPKGRVDARLLKVFSARTLALAERVFENDFNQSLLSADDAQAAKNWSKALGSDHIRALHILESIIENKGKLVIPNEFYPKGVEYQELEYEETA